MIAGQSITFCVHLAEFKADICTPGPGELQNLVFVVTLH